MGKNMNLKDWRYYRSTWKPKTIRNRGPPKVPILRLDDAFVRLSKLRHGSCSQLLMYGDLLRQCGNQGALYHGQRVHAHIIDNGLVNNAFLGELIFQMYARCQEMATAYALFTAMPSRRLFCWNVLIDGYNRSEEPDKALEIYKRMSRENVQPDDTTFCCVLTACARLGDLEETRAVHYRISTGYQPASCVHAAVIRAYAKLSRVDLCESVFSSLDERDVLVWNAMLAAYVSKGDFVRVVSLYKLMPDDVEPDCITFMTALRACSNVGDLKTGTEIHMLVQEKRMFLYTSVQNGLITMYGRCNRVEEARRVFDEIRNRDVFSWYSLIAAYAHCGDYLRALEVYDWMISQGVEPVARTFSAVANAVASIGGSGMIQRARDIHTRSVSSGLEKHAPLQNSLINMYVQCHSLEEAMQVFESMETKDIVGFTTMISAFAEKGHPDKALKLFREMVSQRLKPNDITYATALAACIESGDLSEGIRIHQHMIASGFQSEDPLVSNSLANMYHKLQRPSSQVEEPS